MSDKTIFARNAYSEMLDWKRNLADRYALLVEGARRVGKTFLVRHFVEREYETSIYIDFSLKSPEVEAAKAAFTGESDIPGILERLSVTFKTRLVPGRSCIVFDEVQLFPYARSLIKSFMFYGRYHYIETGSLVGIRENTDGILIPSEEHGMRLYPLTFGEFLCASGETLLKERIEKAFWERTALGGHLHAKALKLFRVFMSVGGMPQSVEAYLQTGDESRLMASEAAKKEILRLYDRDIGRYARGYAAKVRAVFNQIPGALNSREKKFRLSALSPNARTRRFENAFLWLKDAMLANVAYNSTSPDIGLGMSLESSLFKCYLFDTGLLLSLAMAGGHADERLLRGILYDNLGVNEGMFFENAVAQELVAAGHELFFHSVKDNVHPARTMEIDFLFRDGIKICPVEVKSGAKCRSHVSLDRFVAAYSRKLGRKYVICAKDLMEEDGILYLPVYMAGCLFSSAAKGESR